MGRYTDRTSQGHDVTKVSTRHVYSKWSVKTVTRQPWSGSVSVDAQHTILWVSKSYLILLSELGFPAAQYRVFLGCGSRF